MLEFDRPRDLRDIANLGLTLDEAKQLLTGVGTVARLGVRRWSGMSASVL